MYKMLVCDDEKWIREGIRTSIDWAAIGIDTVLTARDGVQAIEIIKEQKPDIVITDIKMPAADGLEMIDAVKKIIDPKCIIVISGFSSFNYAQTALKLGVADYILKPVEETALITAVQKCLARKDKERRADTGQASTVLDRLNLWLNRISPVPPDKDAMIEAFGIDIEKFPFVQAAVWRINIYSANDETPELPVPAQTGKQDSSGEAHLLFRSHGARPAGLFFSARQDAPAPPLEGIFSGKNGETQKWYIGVGSRVFFADGWLSWQQAESALTYGLVFPGQRIFFHDQLLGRAEKPLYHFSEFNLSKPVTLLANRYFLQYRSWVDHIFDVINTNANCLNPKELKDFFVKLVDNIGQIWKLSGGDFKQFQERIAAAWNQKTLRDEFARFPGKLPLYQAVGVKQGFSLALNYIEKHYAGEITMSQTAEALGLNPSYFSKMFSECAGVSFLKFLTKHRMEKAMQMLKESNMKIYEIAEKTGYTDYRVFSRNFKEYCGVSPVDYRNRMI